MLLPILGSLFGQTWSCAVLVALLAILSGNILNEEPAVESNYSWMEISNLCETETIPNCFDLCETMFQACNWGWTLHKDFGLCEKYVNEKVCTKYVFEGELYAECVNVRPRPLSTIHWYIIHALCLSPSILLYCFRPFWRVARMTDSASWEQSCSGDPLIPAYAATHPPSWIENI